MNFVVLGFCVMLGLVLIWYSGDMDMFFIMLGGKGMLGLLKIGMVIFMMFLVLLVFLKFFVVMVDEGWVVICICNGKFIICNCLQCCLSNCGGVVGEVVVFDFGLYGVFLLFFWYCFIDVCCCVIDFFVCELVGVIGYQYCVYVFFEWCLIFMG